MNAYLDIETSFNREITVIGIYKDNYFKQFVGRDISLPEIRYFLKDVSTVYTFNGSRFDLPILKKHLDFDFSKCFRCSDLMYECWEKNLYGGLKTVEDTFGIKRNLQDITGYDAMKLWERFEHKKDNSALWKLLSYNKEDVLNLIKLQEKLNGFNDYIS